MSDSPKSLIYYGPYLKPPIGLHHNWQFKDGILPENVEALIKIHPAFRSLFIPASDLIKTEKALRKSGSAQSQLYNHFKKLLVK